MSTKQLVQPTQGDTLSEVMGYATVTLLLYVLRLVAREILWCRPLDACHLRVLNS